LPLKGSRVAVAGVRRFQSGIAGGLSERGAQVTSVPVYEWGLPEDVGPLSGDLGTLSRRNRCRYVHDGIQVNHLLQIAAEMNQETLCGTHFREC